MASLALAWPLAGRDAVRQAQQGRGVGAWPCTWHWSSPSRVSTLRMAEHCGRCNKCAERRQGFQQRRDWLIAPPMRTAEQVPRVYRSADLASGSGISWFRSLVVQALVADSATSGGETWLVARSPSTERSLPNRIPGLAGWVHEETFRPVTGIDRAGGSPRPSAPEGPLVGFTGVRGRRSDRSTSTRSSNGSPVTSASHADFSGPTPLQCSPACPNLDQHRAPRCTRTDGPAKAWPATKWAGACFRAAAALRRPPGDPDARGRGRSTYLVPPRWRFRTPGRPLTRSRRATV